MEGLRWWFLLLTALMFSMSGCASQEGTFASAHHIALSMQSHPSAASITEDDLQAASREESWGAALPSMDMTGTWRGTWVSRGMYGDERTSGAHATFNQSGKRGFGRIALADVNTASGLPSRIREAGSAGIPVFYTVDGVDVVARDRAGTAVKLTFTRVGDTIYGRIVGAPAPTVLVLEREVH
jgi:hypothetical protein